MSFGKPGFFQSCRHNVDVQRGDDLGQDGLHAWRPTHELVELWLKMPSEEGRRRAERHRQERRERDERHRQETFQKRKAAVRVDERFLPAQCQWAVYTEPIDRIDRYEVGGEHEYEEKHVKEPARLVAQFATKDEALNNAVARTFRASARVPVRPVPATPEVLMIRVVSY